MTRGAADIQPTPVLTEDQFLGGQLIVRQLKRGYRAGLDAVLLAAACPAVAGGGESCLDCGAGAGTAGLAAARRIGDLAVTLVERDPVLAGLAVENVARNGLAERCTVMADDLTRPLSKLPQLAERADRFDHVIANPPYYAHEAGTRSADSLKDGANAMPRGTFDAWVRFAASLARNGGSYTVIQRPEALPELLAALDRRFGRVSVLPLHSREGQPASRIIVQAIKGSRAGLRLLAGRVLHCAGSHAFTPAFDAILREGAALTIE